MNSTIIPFPLHARLRAANDDGPDGPAGGALTTRLQEILKRKIDLRGASFDQLADAA